MEEKIQNNNEQLLEEPINFTDPYVLHDAEIDRYLIPQLYQRQNSTQGRDDDGDEKIFDTIQEYDSEYTGGILYPIVQINNRVIDFTQIEAMIIYYDNFLPTISIKIYDDNQDIQAYDIPGFNNSIKVVIVPKVNNVYKTLYMEFKIIKCDIENTSVIYHGIYNFIPFNKSLTKEITYSGCTNENCNSEESLTPNSWEFLHSIAIECGLGFASTDECKNIKDNLPRIISGEKYSEAIPRQISWGGLDEYSIFDTWIDLYGCLTMVNVAWVLEQANVNPNNLSTKAFVGMHSTDYNSVKQECLEVIRTLTNFNQQSAYSNLIIHNYKTIINNSPLLKGTEIHAMTLNLRDVNGGNNSISQYDVAIQQNSIDGQKIEEYSVQENTSLFIECNVLSVNRQKLIRDKFFAKHRQRILEVELRELNLGLQRGTLVNIGIFEDNPMHKRKLLSSGSNYISETTDTKQDESINGEDDMDIVMLESTQILNPALSGMYYIDYMRFEYTYEQNEIIQFLGLIKRGSTSGIDNKYTAPRTSYSQSQS